MEFDLSVAAFGVHAAIGVLFFGLAGLNLASGSTTPAVLQAGMGLMLVGLGVAVGRVLKNRE